MLNGWITLDKPLGMSSAFAVDKVKKLLLSSSASQRDVRGSIQIPHGSPNRAKARPRMTLKIGHAGTLDPLATGVLVLAVGEATKLINYAMDARKVYSFTVTWGEERDTDDGEGVAVATSEKRPSLVEIEAILPQFTGPIQQVPPVFSAIKVGGKRSYDMARSGEAVELKPREVVIERLQVTGVRCQEEAPVTCHLSPATSATFLTHCSKGTYIRSLARDMGRALGCYGYVSMLRRTASGKLTKNNAISLEKLTEMVHTGDLGFLTPPQAMLDDILAIDLNAEETKQLKNGGWLSKPPELPSGATVACLFEGNLVAIAHIDAQFLKPERVFNII